jgi:hypothetical protein
VASSHDEIGDANLYIRTVFHQMGRPQQIEAARSCGQLIGAAGVTPAIFREDEIDQLFPPESFTLLDSGTDTATASHRLPDGEPARIPAFYAIVAGASPAG